MPAKIFGHRGALGERAENTLEGFHHAKALGAAGVETDIVLTKDFVPVLHHDAALPDGRLIKLLNAAELPSAIPTLKQALLEVPDIEWMLEIKSDPTAPKQTHPHVVIIERVLLDLKNVDRERLRIWAFEWAVLREVERQAPDLKRVCIAGKQANNTADRDLWWGPGFANKGISDAVAATNAVGRASFHSTWVEEDILKTQALGLEVYACILNDQDDFNRLSPLVDGIITDYPSRFV